MRVDLTSKNCLKKYNGIGFTVKKNFFYSCEAKSISICVSVWMGRKNFENLRKFLLQQFCFLLNRFRPKSFHFCRSMNHFQFFKGCL